MFKKFLINEWKDIFKINSDNKILKYNKNDFNPINTINFDEIINYVMSKKIQNLNPNLQFSNQIQWGEDVGAIRMKIPFIKIIIQQLTHNLLGENQWICRKVISVDHKFNSNENNINENLSIGIIDSVENILENNLYSPKNEYKSFENLVRRISFKCTTKGIIPEIFIYTGVKKGKSENNFLITYECRGGGVEAPGSERLEVFHINMSYNPKTGLIRSIGEGIQSPIKGHTWKIQPSEWDEYFLNNQPEHEIINSISTSLKTY